MLDLPGYASLIKLVMITEVVDAVAVAAVAAGMGIDAKLVTVVVHLM